MSVLFYLLLTDAPVTRNEKFIIIGFLINTSVVIQTEVLGVRHLLLLVLPRLGPCRVLVLVVKSSVKGGSTQY